MYTNNVIYSPGWRHLSSQKGTLFFYIRPFARHLTYISLKYGGRQGRDSLFHVVPSWPIAGILPCVGSVSISKWTSYRVSIGKWETSTRRFTYRSRNHQSQNRCCWCTSWALRLYCSKHPIEISLVMALKDGQNLLATWESHSRSACLTIREQGSFYLLQPSFESWNPHERHRCTH